ncbi:GntR family transcriptional regulator [Roseisalinus antarcticus]|uniref:HTH-type transcriptional regulator McbR n=1 Tax=Roseisalinus antarcticus TaxID=254357 RepID=A0A1Y5T168_9RHOB|nr:GntR family transcriptional regulator [Roseisalinus antarcticus]SLN53540.1 HTH-type transcriptional regulator McbR [Roseisalinus antarcticus]
MSDDRRPAGPEPANLRIARELRLQLMRGERAPGEILTHRRLAEQLGVSPMPVRDALRQLLAERALVVANGNRSVAVPQLDSARLHDLKTIRENLEGTAARLAARRWQPHQLARIEAILESSETTGRPDLGKNVDFHFAIYKASQSEVLLPLIESLWLQFGPYLSRVTAMAGASMGTGDTYHRQVVEALRTRDEDAAERAIIADISRAMTLLLSDEAVTAPRARNPNRRVGQDPALSQINRGS